MSRTSLSRFSTVFARVEFIAACAIALVCSACNRTSGDAAGTVGSQNGGDPPSRAARLSSIAGDVSLEPQGSSTWTQAIPNYTITTGDRLYAGPKARAELDFGTSATRVSEGSDLTVSNLTDHFAQLGLQDGTLDESVYQWTPSDSVELDTPNGALMPLAIGSYLITVDQNDNSTIVNVERGRLDVTGPGLDRTLNAGEVVRLVGTNPIQVVAVGGAGGGAPVGGAALPRAYAPPADFVQWSADRERRYVASAPAVSYVGEAIPGWEDLDEAGVWFDVASEGRVWCPSHVSLDWAPYRDGRWRWVEPWGWTWVDDDSWGYAPFHYGRWIDLRARHVARSCSWGWIPGPVISEPIYAPALVAFVDGSGFGLEASLGLQAWFPLGPREPYFPWYHHSDRYLHDVNAGDIREVSNIDPIIRTRNVDAIHWENRDRGLTAVPARYFRAGDPIARSTVRIPSARLAAAPIAPHPSVNPEPQLLAGGPAARRPPLAARPEMVVTRGPRRVAAAPAPVGVPQTRAPSPSEYRTPLVSRNGTPEVRGEVGNRVTEAPNRPAPTAAPGRAPVYTSPAERRAVQQRAAGGEVGPPIAPRRAVGGEVNRSIGPTRTAAAPPAPQRRQIITRNAPSAAPPPPPPAARAAAMAPHPGRPLEPRQIGNIRAQRPAGPPRDVEVPPHPAPAPLPRAPLPPPPPPRPGAMPSQARPQPTPAPAPKAPAGQPARGRRGGAP